MLNRDQRKLILSAQEQTGISRQAWLASLVRQSDHGDELALEQLKLFCREYRKTQDTRKAQAAVILKYNQLEIEGL